MRHSDFSAARLAVPSAYSSPDLRRWERQQIVKERARALLVAVQAVGPAGDAAEVVEAFDEIGDTEFKLATAAQYEEVEGLGVTLRQYVAECLRLYKAADNDGLLEHLADAGRFDPDFLKAMKRFDM